MSRPLALALMAVLAIGCGSESPTPAVTDGTGTPPDTQPSVEPVDLPSDPDEALAVVLDQVESAGSVRMEVGNLLGPGHVVRQDFSRPEGDLELEFLPLDELGGDTAMDLTFLRVDGRYYGGGEEFPGVSDEDDSITARTFRSDPSRELGALITAGDPIAPSDEGRDLGPDVVAFELEAVAEDIRAEDLAGLPPSFVLERLPTTIWVAPDGLPVRLEVMYTEPIGGTEGTGVYVVDYSEWGEPVELTAP